MIKHYIHRRAWLIILFPILALIAFATGFWFALGQGWHAFHHQCRAMWRLIKDAWQA